MRLHGDPGTLLRDTLPEVARSLDELTRRGLVWKNEFGSYDPEFHRYGGQRGIELAERVFHVDSAHVLRVLKAQAVDDEVRWRIGLSSVDILFDEMGLSVSEKLNTTTELTESLFREFRAGKHLRRQIADRFRTYRREVLGLLANAEQSPLSRSMRGYMDRYRELLSPVGEAFRREALRGDLEVDPARIAASLAHMHINRLVRGSARAQELVIYELLRRTYRSELGRCRARRKQA